MNYVQSILNFGFEGVLIEIECQISNGLPSIVIVGLGNKAVDEAKERIRSAFASSNIQLPKKRITINLAPADLPKDSTSLDAAIAAMIMIAGGEIKRTLKAHEAIVGEIGLNGDIRPIRGIIGKLIAGKKLGITRFLIPEGNLEQALLVPGIELIPLRNLADFKRPLDVHTHTKNTETYVTQNAGSPHSFDDISGQESAKRALEIAAAGGHNIILSGPPGTGKSMLAKALPSLLPPLNHEEILEVTYLHSLTTQAYDSVITKRPFRAPHHSSSQAAIIGGGPKITPGEISLSHHGVLLLDEIPEFNRNVLEALRQPLEEKYVTLARAAYSVEYPANFILVATANPCPCGFYGTSKPCMCLPAFIHRYKQRLSGPILDRIDLHVQVDLVAPDTLLSPQKNNRQMPVILKRVMNARHIQHHRFRDITKLNAHMNNYDIRKLAALNADSHTLLNKAAKQLNISARSYMRIIKVARTISDLEESINIQPSHISEALQYRTFSTQ